MIALNTRSQLAKVVQAIQDYTLLLWKRRNEILHNHSLPNRAIVQAELNQAIECLYSLRSTFSPILQSYFSLPLELRL